MKTIAFVLSLIISYSAFAQQVTISPAEIVADMKPGESRNFEVSLQNESKEELKNLNFYIREYINKDKMNMIDTVGTKNKKQPNHDSSISSFVKADTGAVAPIAPKTGRKFTINVSVPKDYKKTVGYFTYSIEPSEASILAASKITTGALMQFFGRGLINVQQPTTVKKIDIAKMQLTKKGVVDLEIKNSGGTVLELEGDIVILDSKNKQLGKFDLTTEYNTKKQLAIPMLKDVSYKLNTAIPPQLISKGNQLLISVRDYKRDFSQSFLKTVKSP